MNSHHQTSIVTPRFRSLISIIEYQEGNVNILSHYYNTVIAFGGGQSVYDGTEWEQPFIHLMRSEKNAFMLAPSLNETEVLSVLDKRIEVDERILNQLFIQSRTSRAVSRRIITGSQNPNDTAAAILREIIISP